VLASRLHVRDHIGRVLGDHPYRDGPAFVALRVDSHHVQSGWQLPVNEWCHAHQLPVDRTSAPVGCD
jgi:hypothetical protein